MITYTREQLLEDIQKIDDFINKDSFLITDVEYDKALSLWNIIFDKFNNYGENNEIWQVGVDNKRARDGLLMKAEVVTDDKGKEKNKYTDKTLEMELDIQFEKDIIEGLKAKYFLKILPNKLKVLEHKLNWIKKIKNI